MSPKKEADPAVAAAFDRCDNGQEITDHPILLPPGSLPRLRVEMCGSPANLVVAFQGKVVRDQTIVDTFDDILPLPQAPDGAYLVWALVPTADKWRLQTEVSVNGAIGFRMRKNNDSELYPHFAVWVKGL